MAKQIKAHINLATKGEHEFLSIVSFENANSDCLRLQDVRLRRTSHEKPFQLPLNLLTWYTEHAAAGREITRDDNNQKNEASLFIAISDLTEQVETFGLKSPFTFEVEISERDRNDESLARSDRGIIELEVNLYHGPRASCDIDASPLHTGEQPLTFPLNCREAGRLDLATCQLRSTQGPLDPGSDKRIILCDIELPQPYENLRHAVIERLSLFHETTAQPRQYVRDEHQYAELFSGFPVDQRRPFPDGAMVFGPLLPLTPKQKAAPLTISLKAPVNDLFWDDFHRCQIVNNHQPLTARLTLLLPEPGGNIIRTIAVKLVMDRGDWLIISDGAARGSPAIIPVYRNEKAAEKSSYTLRVPADITAPPASSLLAVQYYGGGVNDAPVSIALNAAKGDAKFAAVKPEVIEIADHQRHMLLLNTLAHNSKQKNQRATFRLKCFWPGAQHTEISSLTIERKAARPGPISAIDIGSKTITMAEKRGEQVALLPLGRVSPSQYLSEHCLPSRAAVTTGTPQADGGEPDLTIASWRADKDPLGISYSALPWEETVVAARLAALNRHYDLALPAKPGPETRVNLKRLFTGHAVTNADASTTPLVTRNQPCDQEDASALALQRHLDPMHLMADCLDELFSFYGASLAPPPPDTTAENGEETAPVIDERYTGNAPSLVLTIPGQASPAARRRYLDAAASALTNFEQGSATALGAAAELLGMTAPEFHINNVHLVDETQAAAFHCLKLLAEKERPARVRKVQQIHIDIGAAHAGLVALGGWLGETRALIDKSHGAINLPVGGRALELALLKEMSNSLEAAFAAKAPLIANAPLPLSLEEIAASQSPVTEQQRLHRKLLKGLRRALAGTGPALAQSEFDLKICLARSRPGNWPFAMSSMVEFEGDPLKIWQGQHGEHLIVTSDGKPGSWRLDLMLSSAGMAQRVGPLSTYLAFVGGFLPSVVAHCFPLTNTQAEPLISVTGGTALFPPLQKRLIATAKRLGCRMAFLPESFDEAATAGVAGALELITHQGSSPHHIARPNLLLAPLDENSGDPGDILAVARLGNLAIIRDEAAMGTIPPGCTSLKLIETIPGLGGLMQADPASLTCRAYLDDLDSASSQQWQLAEAEWADWLAQCYQIMLNMPVAAPPETGSGPQHWGYQALKEDEARLTIADQTYWISSGLSSSGF